MKASKPWEQRGYFPRKGNAINLTKVIIVIIVLHVSVIIIIITKGNAIHLTNVVISAGEIRAVIHLPFMHLPLDFWYICP